MNSNIFVGKLSHLREKPRKNAFKYDVFFMYLDLDELAALDKDLFLFGLNKWNIFSFFDKDHFKFINNQGGDADVIAQEKVRYTKEKYHNKSTRERIELLIEELDLGFKLGKVFMLTNLRNMGYVFNPVSFYYCFDGEGCFRALFSEVNNTFLDQKMYHIPIDDPTAEMFSSRQKKNYYISPFTDLNNVLHWTFQVPGASLLMKIDSIKGEEVELQTVISGQQIELSNRNLFYLVFRYPLYTLMVMVRIHYQALKLWLKKVPFNRKEPSDAKIVKNINNKV